MYVDTWTIGNGLMQWGLILKKILVISRNLAVNASFSIWKWNSVKFRKIFELCQILSVIKISSCRSLIWSHFAILNTFYTCTASNKNTFLVYSQNNTKQNTHSIDGQNLSVEVQLYPGHKNIRENKFKMIRFTKKKRGKR